MRPRIWRYFFKTAITNIINNRLIHFISMGTICISMLLFASFMLLSLNLNNWVKGWGESLSMSVYLEDGIGEGVKKEIESVLLNLKGGDLKGYISKEQAMAYLKKSLGEQAGLVAGLRDNPLPASFEIIFNDMSRDKIDPKAIKENLEQMEGVNEVQYSEQWIERFQGIMYVLKVSSLIIGGLLCIAVLFISTNTIKLTIYSRREEIEIYKLVGATDWFVKIPYLIEGALQGLAGGIAALLILFLIFSIFTIKPVSLFGLPVLDFVFLSRQLSLYIILSGLFLGFIGGLIAIGRFFKT